MDHPNNILFPGEGVHKSPNTDTDIIHCIKFLSTGPCYLNLPVSNFAHDRYVIPILLQKYIKGGQYSRIPYKEVNRIEDFQLNFFEE